MTHSIPRRPLRYYKNLDGTRGIAALMVLVHHFFFIHDTNYLSNIDFYKSITEFGQHGVSYFFVLSGFVITRILISTKNESNYFKTFYKHRVLRIFPLYYLYLLFVFYLMPIILDTRYVDVKVQLSFYSFLQNVVDLFGVKTDGPAGHFWTLAVEQHFYLIWPLIIYRIQEQNLWKVFGLLIILLIPLKYYMLSQGLVINHFTFTRIDQLICGSFLALLAYNGFTGNKQSYYFVIVGLSVFLMAGLAYYLQNHFIFIKEMTKSTLLAILFASAIGYLISGKQHTVVNRILSSKVLQYLGKISYGIYVWHLSVLFILVKYATTGFVMLDLLLLALISIIIAHISFKYYERIIMRLK